MPEKKGINLGTWFLVIIIIGLIIVMALFYLTLESPPTTPYPLLSGSLTYSKTSSPENGSVAFQLSLSQPTNPLLSNVNIQIVKGNQLLENFTINWMHFSSDNVHIRGGDVLTIEIPNTDLRGCEVLISIHGYTGVIQGNVPEN